MSRYYYQATVRHDGLGKHRVIRGDDRQLVEAAVYAQERAWTEQYAKKLEIAERRRERAERKQELEDGLAEAELRTDEAKSAIGESRNILSATLRVDDRVDWDKLKQLQPFSQPQPEARPYHPIPQEPQPDEAQYRPQLGLLDKFWRPGAQKKEQAAQAIFAADHAKWQQTVAAVEATNQQIYETNLRELQDWERRSTAFEEAREKHNAAIDRRRSDYQALNPDAVLDYCDMVLSASKYPECCPQNFELEYQSGAKILVVEYQLPAPNDLPRLAEVKYIRSRGEFVESELSKRQFEQLYEDVVSQIAIRTLHELFEADVVRAFEDIVFNGMVSAVNPGSGHVETRCVMSVRTSRDAYLRINLRNVEARACFDSLGGIAGGKLADLREVTPASTLNRGEDRFAHAEDISGAGNTALNEWRELVEIISQPTDGHFIKLGSLASLVGFPTQDKYSAALSRDLASAVNARGYAVEPDAALGGPSYRGEDEVVLFRPLDNKVGDAYIGAAALLQFCVTIAAADEHPTEAELEVARDFINKNLPLSPHERQRLHFLERLLCRNPQLARRPLARLAKRLSVEQRQKVGEVLVCVAGADGKISSTEWTALDRACKTLALPPSALEDILRQLGASFEEPTVQEAEVGEPGETLPARPTAPAPPPAAPAFKLDMSRVAAISHETAQVVSLLSAVMQEDEPKPERQPEPGPPPVAAVPPPGKSTPPAWMADLNGKYHGIAVRVISRTSWSRGEFHQLAAEFQLMPLGVYDALNEWADEHLGDFLLEGEDPVTVNASILPK